MGIFKEKRPEDAHEAEQLQLLNPLEPPLEVFRGYARNEQAVLSFQSKVFNVKEDPFDVKDDNGNTVVKVTGSPFWIKHFKTVSGPDGKVLFNMRSKLLSWTRTFICEAGDEGSTQYFHIQRRFSLRLRLDARTTSTVGDAQFLHLVGSLGGFKAEVTDDSGNVVAVMSLAFWKKGQVMKNRQSYYCNVAPGVDLAVISALCLAWDQCKEDDKRRGGGS